LIENAFALFLVLLVNVAIVSITGTICDGSQLVDDNCSSLTLDSTSVLLKVSTDESLCSISCKLYIEAYQLLSVGLSYINNNPSIRNCRSFWYF
jgi:natural resistance-associated macrophage protein